MSFGMALPIAGGIALGGLLIIAIIILLAIIISIALERDIAREDEDDNKWALYFHYTRPEGRVGILQSRIINPTLYEGDLGSDGVYLTDVKGDQSTPEGRKKICEVINLKEPCLSEYTSVVYVYLTEKMEVRLIRGSYIYRDLINPKEQIKYWHQYMFPGPLGPGVPEQINDVRLE